MAQYPEMDEKGKTPPLALEWLLDSALEQNGHDEIDNTRTHCKAVSHKTHLDSCSFAPCGSRQGKVLAVPRVGLAIARAHVEVVEPTMQGFNSRWNTLMDSGTISSLG